MFSVQPAIDATGRLTYTPAPNANGSATVFVQAHDDGGTANGGGDTSSPQSFTITVSPVNDPPSSPAATWDAANDYEAGWTEGINPNGAWSYGWSSSVSSALTLYPRNYINASLPDFRLWDDPSHQASLVPAVYKNVGPLYTSGPTRSIFRPEALVLHGGGPSGNDYSHVLWTAPSTGSFTVDAIFTGRQFSTGGFQTYVDVLKNGTVLFEDYLNSFGDSATYSAVLSLSAGDKIDFAVGISGTGLHGESTQLDATIVATSPAIGNQTVSEGCACLFYGPVERLRG